MSQTPLERATAYSNALVQEAGGDVSRLPEPVQTVVVVDTAQGIIDNGGLEYFYESDFPGNPPYSFFVETFRRIGAESVASCIEVTYRMFPFPEPHLHEGKRQQWLESVKHDESHEFVRLSRRACGDESVFRKLAEYVETNRHEYGAV
ncbi:DMP19 family protein [Diaphorobacter nitroreducens]|uniref:DMP19 family protein n=1 Tax=Diaphorobacter nitroreducens TaxID=164759 RepID=UPI00289689A3|nr:DUF4375 domain-containing protein [Diaphorobacter nitroreducens]